MKQNVYTARQTTKTDGGIWTSCQHQFNFNSLHIV